MLRICSLLVLVCATVIGATADGPPRPRVAIVTNHGTVVAELFADQAPDTVTTFLGLATGERAWTDPNTQEEKRQPLYDGLVFHRVIPGFMIQGGDPLGSGAGGPGFQFADEINADSLGLAREVGIGPGGNLHPSCAYMQDQIFQQVVMPRLQARGLNQELPEERQRQIFMAVIQELEGTSLKAIYEGLGYRYRADLPASTPPTRGVLAMANAGPGTNGSQFFITLGDTPHLTGKHTVFGRVVAGMEVVDAIGAVATGPSDRPLQAVTITSIRPLPSTAE